MDAVKARDGLDLVTTSWPTPLAPGVPARGLVVIVHGLGEHCGRYAHVAKRFNDAGFDAVCFARPTGK